MQWVQDPSQSNIDTLNSVRREARRHFSSKMKDINDFTMGYKLRNNIVKDEKGDLFAESHSILAKWRNHFFQLLNIDRVNDVRQTNTHSRTTCA
jgi:hypothetical protein